ncbi:MAG: transglutaminase domain-containing protein [Synergistaceae bacterium]|jgi:transglutaminase-like putative cysteine protease|nr:transglutaminase domain-containing protein [Synergistaceae bacterium]
MYSDLRYLLIDLPEDIARLKAAGCFERAGHVIDKRLRKQLPLALRKRLELEKEILARVPSHYPHSYDRALSLLSSAFRDFEPEELEALWEEDALDWIFIEGKPFFKDDIVANLAKTRKELTARVTDPSLLKDKEGNFSLLDETIAKMKRRGTLAYRIRIRTTVTVKPESVEEGKTVRVHLPIPVEYAQIHDFKLLDAGPAPKFVAAPDYPQRTVYFEERLQSGQEFFVEYEYVNRMDYVEARPEAAVDAQPTFYTEEQAPHVVFTPYIRDLAGELAGGEKNPLLRARRVYDFLTTRLIYSFVRSYFTIPAIPTYAATGLKGDCGIQALTFITLCRALGVPARWQSGLYANPRSIGNHDWAQFYVTPYGWLYADCSFGGAAWQAGAEERWNFYFGNLEPFRMPANSDFQFDFNPAKKFRRCDPYDNQNGEVEYEHRGLGPEEYSTVHKVVNIEEVGELELED